MGSAQSLQQGSPSLPDPLGSDNSDENLAAIAKRFEEKYVSMIISYNNNYHHINSYTGTQKEKESST